MSIRSAAWVVITMLATPALGFAQAPVTGFDGGFYIQSPDGDNRLTFGVVAQIDGRFSTDDPAPVVDTFTVRKARPTFSGRMAKYFDFKLVPDFGNGKAVVQDAYIGIRVSQAFRIRVGKDKTPIGYELLGSDPYLLFPERSLASSLVPNRDVGIAVQGDVARARLSYAGGLYNGIPDDSSSSADVDTNNAKDLAGRVIVRPFAHPGDASPLSGLGFHLGGSTGTASGPLPTFSTSARASYFSYLAGAAANGSHTRVTPAVFYYDGPLGAFAEYARSSQQVARSTTRADVTNHAWNISGSWLLTGERASYGMVRPAHDFDPEQGGWGALQLVARYSALTIDRRAFDLALASPTASREAKQLTVGANWILNPFVKFYGTYERTSFQSDVNRPPEHVILFRTQLALGDHL